MSKPRNDVQTAFDLYAELAKPVDWSNVLGFQTVTGKIEIHAVWGLKLLRGIRFAKGVPVPADDRIAYLVFIRDSKIVYYLPYMYLNHAVNALRFIVSRLKGDKQISHVKILGKNRFYHKAEIVLRMEVSE